jgi:hypothetical protein
VAAAEAEEAAEDALREADEATEDALRDADEAAEAADEEAAEADEDALERADESEPETEAVADWVFAAMADDPYLGQWSVKQFLHSWLKSRWI